MFLQVVMSQLCTAVCIMWPHVLRAASSSAVQLFAQDESDRSSGGNEHVAGKQPTAVPTSANAAAATWPGRVDLLGC